MANVSYDPSKQHRTAAGINRTTPGISGTTSNPRGTMSQAQTRSQSGTMGSAPGLSNAAKSAGTPSRPKWLQNRERNFEAKQDYAQDRTAQMDQYRTQQPQGQGVGNYGAAGSGFQMNVPSANVPSVNPGTPQGQPQGYAGTNTPSVPGAGAAPSFEQMMSDPNLQQQFMQWLQQRIGGIIQ